MSSPVEAGPVFSIPENILPPRSAGPVDMAQAFPVLTAGQIDRIRPFGRVRQVKAGEILFDTGDIEVPFFVLLSGSMEIVQPGLQGERQIVTHHAGGFTGEMTMISRRGALARGRVTTQGEFLELSAEELQTLVARDADLSELFMRAFILRRLLLISYGQGNAVLLGSRHSANTLHLREFLSRNGHPHTYIDLDVDQGAQELLDRFSITPAEIPVVICNGVTVLRNPTTQELAKCLGLNANITATEGLRCIGGPGCVDDRDGIPRWAGGFEFEDRKLSRFSDRCFGIGIGWPSHRAGAEIRRQDAGREQRDQAELRAASLRIERGLRPNHPCQSRDHRQRSALQQAADRES
jgi:hypothetical protein